MRKKSPNSNYTDLPKLKNPAVSLLCPFCLRKTAWWAILDTNLFEAVQAKQKVCNARTSMHLLETLFA
jgi:hypothetical protein